MRALGAGGGSCNPHFEHTHSIHRRDIFATAGGCGYADSCRDPRRRNHGRDRRRIAGAGPQGENFYRFEGTEEGRPVRVAGGEQHSLGGDGPGAHGRRADRRAAVFAAGAGGVGRDDEGLHAVAGVLRGCGAAGWDCAELAGGSAAVLFDEIFAGVDGVQLERPQVGMDSPVTIIYTSGTSGEAKGVVLTAANVGFMLDRTAERLEQLMSGSSPVTERAGSHLSLLAVYVCGVVDCAADVSEAAKPGHDQHGSDEDRE